MSNLSPVKLAPAFKDYLWGGTKLYVEAIGKEALGEKAKKFQNLQKHRNLKMRRVTFWHLANTLLSKRQR